MTTQTNREKNIAHTARQAAKARPAPTAYNFEDLERAVRTWATGSPTAAEEVYSPYRGA